MWLTKVKSVSMRKPKFLTTLEGKITSSMLKIGNSIEYYEKLSNSDLEAFNSRLLCNNHALTPESQLIIKSLFLKDVGILLKI